MGADSWGGERGVTNMRNSKRATSIYIQNIKTAGKGSMTKGRKWGKNRSNGNKRYSLLETQ